jgi:thioredoxin-related protein
MKTCHPKAKTIGRVLQEHSIFHVNTIFTVELIPPISISYQYFCKNTKMKSIFLFLFLSIAFASFAQLDTMRPAYQRYPTVPSLQLILEDSATKYTKADLPKNKPLLLMMFSPDCEHCKQEASQIAANIGAFKNMHIVMTTPYPIYRMREFAATTGISGLKNIVVAKDHYYLLPPFFAMRNFPFMALYDRKGNLIKTIEGATSIKKILEAIKEEK